jgi:SAM-dependent methyltransferase
MAAERPEDKAITLGHPSYVWRFGQDRRLDLMRRHAPLDGRRILDVGCGLGMYVRRFRALGAEVYGVDVDPDKVTEASRDLPNIQTAPAEILPFPDARFDVVLLHEVLEHVTDDRRAVAEALRVTDTSGRVLVFVPNRWYPFETHGAYWRGRYHFGTIPLINYLPDRWRNRLAPHVRVYTGGDLRRLVDGLPGRVVYHTQIYPGFDNLVTRRPRLGAWLRRITYAFERTPLRAFGLSHFMVIEKT